MLAIAPPWLQKQWQWLTQAGIDRLPHALILSAKMGSGKRHFAKALAHLLLCQNQPNRSPAALTAQQLDAPVNTRDGINSNLGCGQCQACHWLEKSVHPDYFFYSPNSRADKKNEGITRIRQLIEFCHLSAHQQGWKVVVVENADTLSQAAHNALLKTLEEPAEQILIVLLVRQLSRLPVTIISRCQQVDLSVQANDALDFLQSVTPQDSFDRLQLALKIAQQTPLLAWMFLELGLVDDYWRWQQQCGSFLVGRMAGFELVNQWQDYRIDGSGWSQSCQFEQQPLIIEMPILDWLSQDLGDLLQQPEILNRVGLFGSLFEFHQLLEQERYFMNSSTNKKFLLHHLLMQYHDAVESLGSHRSLLQLEAI